MTGSTFPTGDREEDLAVYPRNTYNNNQSNNGGCYQQPPFTVRAILIDVSNPFIFVDSSSLPASYHAAAPDSETSLEIIQAIRREGSV